MTDNPISQIERLQELRTSGAISDDEYEALKAEVTRTITQPPSRNSPARIAAVFVGIAVYALVWALGMILIGSRVPPPYTFLPGLGMFWVAWQAYVVARKWVLDRSDADDPDAKPQSKPLRWLVKGLIAFAAFLAGSFVFGFLVASTPLTNWQGDYQVIPSVYTAEEWAWSDTGGSYMAQYRGAVDRFIAADTESKASVGRVSAIEISLLADAVEDLEWPQRYVPAKSDMVIGMRLKAKAFDEISRALAQGDLDMLESGLRLSAAADEYIDSASEFLWNN